MSFLLFLDFTSRDSDLIVQFNQNMLHNSSLSGVEMWLGLKTIELTDFVEPTLIYNIDHSIFC